MSESNEVQAFETANARKYRTKDAFIDLRQVHQWAQTNMGITFDFSKAEHAVSYLESLVAEQRKVIQAAARRERNEYLGWAVGGGPNECPHGRAEGVECPHCDRRLTLEAATAIGEEAEHGSHHGGSADGTEGSLS